MQYYNNYRDLLQAYPEYGSLIIPDVEENQSQDMSFEHFELRRRFSSTGSRASFDLYDLRRRFSSIGVSLKINLKSIFPLFAIILFSMIIISVKNLNLKLKLIMRRSEGSLKIRWRARRKVSSRVAFICITSNRVLISVQLLSWSLCSCLHRFLYA